MRPRLSTLRSFFSVALAGFAHAHVGPFHKAMYCVNGTVPGVVDLNNNAPVTPLFQLTYNEYWSHAINNCDKFPPDPDVFLELPAGGNFTLELAGNRAQTSLNHGAVLSAWGDGLDHPDDYNNPDCITQPNLHAQNQSMAAGTAVAIAYKSNIHEVTPEDLVVFTVRYNTPWKRVTSYDVPSGMPPCPQGGCICVFGWVPNHCGEPNIYLFPLNCNVTPDSTPPKTIGAPKPPVWCKDDPGQCVKGPKQVLIWNQKERNNIEVPGTDWDGLPNSPGYNSRCGFKDGAQNDIFVNGSDTAWNTSTLPASGTSGLPLSRTSGLPASSTLGLPVSRTSALPASSTWAARASASAHSKRMTHRKRTWHPLERGASP